MFVLTLFLSHTYMQQFLKYIQQNRYQIFLYSFCILTTDAGREIISGYGMVFRDLCGSRQNCVDAIKMGI